MTLHYSAITARKNALHRDYIVLLLYSMLYVSHYAWLESEANNKLYGQEML